MLKICKPVALLMMLIASAYAVANERAIIVFDGSGSMWGQIDGKPKHEIARQALGNMLETVPDTMELGLMAYGHREKGSCTDIEMLVTPGKNNKTAVLQAVQNMSFLGKTPLSAAVQQAADALRYTEDKATVILITDGEETCQADPCALGAELKQSGVDFTAHVVGFGLSRQQGEQVACLAHNTGGQYFAANDAVNLSKAMNAALEAVQTASSANAVQPEPLPTPDLPLATVSGPETAQAGTVIEVTWSGPNGSGDYITIVTPEAKDSEYGVYKRTASGEVLRLQVPDALGTHEIRYVQNKDRQVLARQTVELTPVEATVSGPESVGAGGTIEVQWTGPDSPGDYITVVEAGAPDKEYNNYARTASRNPVSLVVPDGLGNYEIRYVLNNSKRVLASQPINITPVSARLELLNTAVPGGKVTVAWTGPDNQSDYVTVVPKGAPANKYLDYARTSSGSPLVIKMPAQVGEYELRYVLNSSTRVLASLPVTLAETAGTITVPDSVVAGSVIEVTWSGPGNRQDFIEVVPMDATPETAPLAATRVSQGSPLSVHAPAIPGIYQVRYMMRDTKEVLTSRQVEVKPNP
ncbi:MAG: VWA domain-containing protein [Advenella sp.]|uniref:VWA domain-containing protein n=1 Tax=Advenella sp. TaxID=1872388 RepID=UPI00258D94B0|nr:VWA domain-containing protein [Advenella sp.]MDD3756618.1 VWA domain-containing protein [Advenella sp.]